MIELTHIFQGPYIYMLYTDLWYSHDGAYKYIIKTTHLSKSPYISDRAHTYISGPMLMYYTAHAAVQASHAACSIGVRGVRRFRLE